jgi:superfamily II DNA or RNA helicase
MRGYQRDCVDAIRKEWANGVRRVAAVIPTGGGKTIIFSHMASDEEQGRTLILAHRQELVDQAAGKICAVAPRMNVGVDMADRRADASCHAVVASVQTLASERRIRRWERDAFTQVIVDECHHSVSKTYLGILDYFGSMAESGGTRTAGFTATLQRGDGIGLGSVWRSVAYTRSLVEMIAEGFLVNPAGISVQVDADFSAAPTSHGDYTAAGLGEILEDSGFEKIVAEAYCEHATGRPGIVFTPTVATAQAAARALCEVGVKAEAVWGDMDPVARRAAVEGLRDGTLDVLSNCQVLTEGTDIPRAEVAVMARPTRSATLYTQMAGRVLRPYPGKTGALIIDLVGVTADHKLKTLVDLAAGQIPGKRDDDRAEDGETLTDAVQRIAHIKLGAARAVDLFAESASVWLQTSGGYWFIPAGGGYIALLPGPGGQYAVALFPPGDSPPQYGRPVPELALAMALGEERASAMDGRGVARVRTASRDAPWRRRNAAPSEKQLAACRRMRVAVPPGANAGDVSDLISVRVASRRIDRYFRPAFHAPRVPSAGTERPRRRD